MNAPTAFSPSEIQAWRRIPAYRRRRVTLGRALRRALVCGFGLFVLIVGAVRLIGGAW